MSKKPVSDALLQAAGDKSKVAALHKMHDDAHQALIKNSFASLLGTNCLLWAALLQQIQRITR